MTTKDGILDETGIFEATPKYFTDSTKTDRMARFFISDQLHTAISEYYGPENITNRSVLDALKDPGYFSFVLSSVSDASQARYQLSETLGKNFVLFGFNEAPEILSCNGYLKNTQEDEWKTQFLELFKKYGSISSLAKLYGYKAKNQSALKTNYLTFKYDSHYKRGALLNVTHSLDAGNEMDIPFSFTFVVTKDIPFTQKKGTSIALNSGTEAKVIDGHDIPLRDILAQTSFEVNPAYAVNYTPPALDKNAADELKKTS